MTQFAMEEVGSLVASLKSPIDDRNPVLRYICALFAELAYYHVPQSEVDDWKRAKLIPCESYQIIVQSGRGIDITMILQQLDLPRPFIAIDRGVVAFGVVLNRLLFIGFRGTQFLFDWKINFGANMAPITGRFRSRGPFFTCGIIGRFHSGFAEEAMRISSRISDAVRDSNLGDFDHVLLTGHSLGGAVAAIAENFVGLGPTSVCIFGSPRYGDVSSYSSLPVGPPSQIRRPGDIVPTTPPRIFGYVDHPYVFSTNGEFYLDPAPYTWPLGDVARWIQFLVRRFEPHSIEAYRKELGISAKAVAAMLPLISEDKLTRAQIPA